MRHHHRRAANHQAIQRVLHDTLALRVKRARRLVQKKDLRVLHDGAGNRNALLLTARKLDAALAEHRVVALGQSLDERVGVRRAGRLLDLLHARVRATVRNVVSHAHVEQHGLLGHQANLRAHVLQVEVAHILSVDQDLATKDVVEALDEADDRALAAARLAHQGDRLAGLD